MRRSGRGRRSTRDIFGSAKTIGCDPEGQVNPHPSLDLGQHLLLDLNKNVEFKLFGLNPWVLVVLLVDAMLRFSIYATGTVYEHVLGSDIVRPRTEKVAITATINAVRKVTLSHMSVKVAVGVTYFVAVLEGARVRLARHDVAQDCIDFLDPHCRRFPALGGTSIGTGTTSTSGRHGRSE